MGPAEIRQFCPLDETSTNLVKAAMQQMQLSARTYHRILKLARTIADLAGEADIQTPRTASSLCATSPNSLPFPAIYRGKSQAQKLPTEFAAEP